jgi:peptidyl-prolyl cis-trans isomerase B (cyclophilin B)
MRNALLFFTLISLFSCAKPLAKFDYSQTKKVAPASVNFSNDSQNADSYMWDFGDGNTSTEASPTHVYTLSGNYDVVLTAIKGGKKTTKKQSIEVTAPKECLVYMETNHGDMVFKLHDLTPLHRDNFSKIAEEGYYDDLLFHRIIDGFMIQGGDPKSRGADIKTNLGSGGPGYQVDAEFNAELSHVKGALAAARTGGPSNPKKRSSGSQFYIVHGKPLSERELDNLEKRKGIVYSEETKMKYLKEGGTPFLDMDYTVFGQMIEGWDVLDKIAGVQTNGSDRPLENVVIKKVTVVK